MNKFLTIKQAVEFSGKSKSTIRRLIDEIAKGNSSEIRSQILPSAEDVERLRRRNEAYTWKVSEDLLRDRFGVGEEGSAETSSGLEENGTATAEQIQAAQKAKDVAIEKLTAMLEAQLESKDKQLEKKDAQIEKLQEQLGANHLVMAHFQKRLVQLGGPKELDVVEIADDRVRVRETEEEPSKPKKERRKLFGVF